MLAKFMSDFWLFFATIDPVGSLIIFLGITSGMDASRRRVVAFKSILCAGAILVGFLALGQIVLEGIGVRIVAFQIAGSIILFLFGLQMFFAKDAEPSAERDPGFDPAIYPLAIPSIASPGAILAVILSTDNYRYSLVEQACTGSMLLVVLAMTLLGMLFADRINALIGKNGEKVMIRLSGLILTAIACEFCIEAFETLRAG